MTGVPRIARSTTTNDRADRGSGLALTTSKLRGELTAAVRCATTPEFHAQVTVGK
jgi:hypothetical protein